ncbi:MAG: hypothetical protein R2686_06250 [Candidatus Nanopelagicales bacterium]
MKDADRFPHPHRAALVRPAIATAVVGLLGVGGVGRRHRRVIAASWPPSWCSPSSRWASWRCRKVLASNPALGLNVALRVYMGQIGGSFILLAALRDATFFDPQVFAGTIVACARWCGRQ